MSLRLGPFLRNIGLFLVVFLPTAAVVAMVLNNIFGDCIPTSPDWKVGWNPLLWFIMTAPWLFPLVVIVPLQYFLGRSLVRRYSRAMARRVLLGMSPALFLLAVLVLWGPDNFEWDFVVQVVTAGLVFGAVQRIPDHG